MTSLDGRAMRSMRTSSLHSWPSKRHCGSNTKACLSSASRVAAVLLHWWQRFCWPKHGAPDQCATGTSRSCARRSKTKCWKLARQSRRTTRSTRSWRGWLSRRCRGAFSRSTSIGTAFNVKFKLLHQTAFGQVFPWSFKATQTTIFTNKKHKQRRMHSSAGWRCDTRGRNFHRFAEQLGAPPVHPWLRRHHPCARGRSCAAGSSRSRGRPPARCSRGRPRAR